MTVVTTNAIASRTEVTATSALVSPVVATRKVASTMAARPGTQSPDNQATACHTTAMTSTATAGDSDRRAVVDHNGVSCWSAHGHASPPSAPARDGSSASSCRSSRRSASSTSRLRSMSVRLRPSSREMVRNRCGTVFGWT